MKKYTSIILPADKYSNFKKLLEETGLSSGELAKKLALEAIEKGHADKKETWTFSVYIEKSFIDEMKGKNLSALIASVL